MAEPPAGYAPGGLMHGYRATYSQDTKNLLKTMMNESKLTNFQQRQLDKAVKEGATLPKSCNPTSSAKSRQPQQKKIIGKVLNPRNYSSHIRNKDQIEASGAYERERFQPAPQTKFGGKYEKDKQRLANIMAFGEDIGPESAASQRRSAALQSKKMEQEQLPVDRFTELQTEIEERREFLDEMRRLGRGTEYQKIIETEISQMVREMELIDRRENTELERRIREQEREKCGPASSTGTPAC